MLRTILGSAIGGLLAGAVALGVSAQMRSTPAPAMGADPNNPYAMTVANTGALSQGASVQCQPYQEPVVRRVMIGGREVAEVTCATAMGAQPGYYAPQPAYASQAAYAPEMVSMPVQRTRAVARPAVTRRRAAANRQRTVAYEEDRQRTVAYEEDRREGRSWGKTAMVIGGSAGGGAGIGGLIGGKKGALIGAAIGGGAATIYESRKR